MRIERKSTVFAALFKKGTYSGQNFIFLWYFLSWDQFLSWSNSIELLTSMREDNNSLSISLLPPRESRHNSVGLCDTGRIGHLCQICIWSVHRQLETPRSAPALGWTWWRIWSYPAGHAEITAYEIDNSCLAVYQWWKALVKGPRCAFYPFCVRRGPSRGDGGKQNCKMYRYW